MTHQETIQLETSGHRAVHDITALVEQVVSASSALSSAAVLASSAG